MTLNIFYYNEKLEDEEEIEEEDLITKKRNRIPIESKQETKKEETDTAISKIGNLDVQNLEKH